MEYTPRYAQPFTLTEAKLLDVQTITEEITRLQNSLQRLDETQKMLREYVASIKAGEAPADPEITKALEENVAVIGSQTERISILKMALADIGIIAGSHYDLAPPASTTPAAAETRPPAPTTEDDDGVDL
ncbi:hypothetical protein FB45DRAFT_1055121 [Roridomyces roridus]|uniref:EIF3F/CSN6-like C-terminal domain-containing protein n=1 Tax=Roridomyces roridus TaxID=1738132 RepID=A0AAD7FRM7_9AGAR|nr:hypothetical protein FB45DRAFT_1055121 [Roridomyces roridus]